MAKCTLLFLDRFHWLWLVMAAPFLLFPSPKGSPIMLVVPALLILRFLAYQAQKKAIPRDTQATIQRSSSTILNTPYNVVLLLMLLMVLVSMWATFDINLSYPKISGLVLGLGLFYTFSREAQTPRGWWLGLLILMAIGCGISAIGLLGTHWVTKVAFLNPIVSRLSPRIFTGLPGVEEGFNQNSVAGALLWMIPSYLTFSWLILTRAKDLRGVFGRGKAKAIIILMIGVTMWTIATLALSQSREGYIGLALTLIVMAMTALPLKWRHYGLAILALLAIIIGIVGLASNWEIVPSWATGNSLAAGSALSLDTFQVRTEIWSRAINGIQDFPFTGMGMNAFRKVTPALYPLFQIPLGEDIGHAHNEFLQAALDLGIPGLIAFIGLYLIAFWMLIRTWQCGRAIRKFASDGQSVMSRGAKPGGWFSVFDISPLADVHLVQMAVLGLGGGLLAHLLWGLTDAMALGARPAFIFWIILGLISGLHQQAQNYLAEGERNVS